MRRGLAALAALAALATLWAPSPVLACAACVAAADRNRAVFFLSTMVLSVLPLALIGGGLWWIARHARARLAGEFVERETPAGAAGQAASGPGEATASAPGVLFAAPRTGGNA